MTIHLSSSLRRRSLLKLGSAGAVSAALPPWADAAMAATPRNMTALRAAPATAAILGANRPDTPVLAYNGKVSGPVLRLRQGEPFGARVTNGLNQATTVHWHGMRLPNAMDGVPGLTQPPIRPGAEFHYAFTPPDAGTYWYHPHDHTAHQMGRGMAGALIVEEPEAPPFDRDVIWVLQDWSFEPDDRFVPGFDTPMEAAMSGRIGSVVTINGVKPASMTVQAGERIRLRLINACLARFMALRFTGHHVRVIALDGQPLARPFAPNGGQVIIAPAQRVDLQLDTIGAPGRDYPVIDDFYGSDATYRLTTLTYSKASRRASLPPAPVILPPNPVPRPDLHDPVRHQLTITGGMMGMGMAADGGPAPIWGIEDQRRMNDGMAPIFTIPRGRTALITLDNRTSFWHPMHLHGYSFTVLSRSGVRARYPYLRDTVILRPQDRVTIAFVADNPGDWMFHCHVIEHQSNGLMTVIRVA